MNKKDALMVLGTIGVIIFLSSLLFAAVVIENQQTTDEVPLSESVSPPDYYYDSGGEVVCYTVEGSASVGLSCVPIEQTKYNISDFQ